MGVYYVHLKIFKSSHSNLRISNGCIDHVWKYDGCKDDKLISYGYFDHIWISNGSLDYIWISDGCMNYDFDILWAFNVCIDHI